MQFGTSALPMRTGCNDREYIDKLEQALKQTQRENANLRARVDVAERRARYMGENYVPKPVIRAVVGKADGR